MEAPTKTPTEAMMTMVRNFVTFAPMAEFKKFTASLLTPTTRSNIARMIRKITIPKKNVFIKSDTLSFFAGAKILTSDYPYVTQMLQFCYSPKNSAGTLDYYPEAEYILSGSILPSFRHFSDSTLKKSIIRVKHCMNRVNLI